LTAESAATAVGVGNVGIVGNSAGVDSADSVAVAAEVDFMAPKVWANDVQVLPDGYVGRVPPRTLACPKIETES
jgi:hypothetical protein